MRRLATWLSYALAVIYLFPAGFWLLTGLFSTAYYPVTLFLISWMPPLVLGTWALVAALLLQKRPFFAGVLQFIPGLVMFLILFSHLMKSDSAENSEVYYWLLVMSVFHLLAGLLAFGSNHKSPSQPDNFLPHLHLQQ